MRKWILAVAMMAGMAAPAWAETIHVGVDGLVCAFCVKGIEKGFSKQDAVSAVTVNLDEKLVTLTTKPEQTLTDDAITDVITSAGYTVTGIHRQE